MPLDRFTYGVQRRIVLDWIPDFRGPGEKEI